MIYDLQKASVLKRIAAYLLDFILITIVVTGLAFLLSAITGYDDHRDRYYERVEFYEEKYGLSVEDADFDNMSDELKAKYEEMDKEFGQDETARIAYTMMRNLVLIIITLSILIAYVLLEFAVPLFFKNGQTVGKKIFGLGVMQVNGVRLKSIAHFTRAILGKCVVETLVPVLILMMAFLGNGSGLIALILLALFELILIIATKTNSCIHDALTQTVVIDLSSQMIFDTEDDLIAYKKKIHQEMAEKREY